MWGGKVSLNKKSLALLGTSFKKSERLSAYIHAQLLFKSVTCRISSKSWNRVPSLTCFMLSLAVTRVEPQILCHTTLPSGDVLCVAANAACKSRTDAVPDGMNNICAGLS
eukprot:432098-Ditylum_brightwellii.AAC.1